MQPRILGLVDNAHPSTAKFFDDAVVRDRAADERRSIRVHVAAIVVGAQEQVNESRQVSITDMWLTTDCPETVFWEAWTSEPLTWPDNALTGN